MVDMPGTTREAGLIHNFSTLDSHEAIRRMQYGGPKTITTCPSTLNHPVQPESCISISYPHRTPNGTLRRCPLQESL